MNGSPEIRLLYIMFLIFCNFIFIYKTKTVVVDPLYSIYPPKFRWLIFPPSMVISRMRRGVMRVHLSQAYNKTSPSVSFVFTVDLLLSVICRETIRPNQEMNQYTISSIIYKGFVLWKTSDLYLINFLLFCKLI